MRNAYRSARNTASVAASKTVSSRSVSAPLSATAKKEQKINRGYRALSVRVFADWFSQMVTNVSASPLFEKSEPTPEALAAINTAYQTAVQNAKNRTGPNAVPAEHEQMLLAKDATDQLADWIESQTENQAQMTEIARMVFNHSKSRLVPRPDQVTGVRLSLSGVRTMVYLRCDPQSDLSGIRYFVESSVDKGKTWQIAAVGSSTRQIAVSNLIKGQDYLLRMFAETSGGKGESSDPAIEWTGQ